VLWTRSHCEQIVHDQLAAHGFVPFLPLVQSWRRRGGVRHRVSIPLFKGYLFLRHRIDKSSYVQVCKTRGLVRVLGERWDRLAVVPDADIEAIRKITATGGPVLPHPYLRAGQRVRVTRGLLAGVEGIVVRSDPKKGSAGGVGRPPSAEHCRPPRLHRAGGRVRAWRQRRRPLRGSVLLPEAGRRLLMDRPTPTPITAEAP